jgi:hypothetical protein
LDNPEEEKVVHHPFVGELALEHLSFQVCNSPDLIMTIHSPLPVFNTAYKLQTLYEKQMYLV